MKGMKLVGGLLNLPDKNELAYPSNLIPVFKYNNEYYIQIAKKAKYLYSFLEDAEFQKIEDSQLENSNKSAFLTITDAKDINISMKVYLLALSKNNIIAGNLVDFTNKLNQLQFRSAEIASLKEFFNKKTEQYLKYGHTFHCETSKAYFEQLQEKRHNEKERTL